MTEAVMAENLSAFMKSKRDLIGRFGSEQWVVFANESFQGAFNSFGEAFLDSCEKFDDGTFMIRSLVSEESEIVPVVFSME